PWWPGPAAPASMAPPRPARSTRWPTPAPGAAARPSAAPSTPPPPSPPGAPPVAPPRAWGGRSPPSRTVNPVHDLLRRAATAAPPALRAQAMGLARPDRLEGWRARPHPPTPATAPPARRAGVMGLARPDRLEERLTDAIDTAVTTGTTDHARPPRSVLWPLIGVLQTLGTVALAAGLLWYLPLYLAGRASADLPDLPTVGDVPVPLLLVIGSLLAGWLLSRLLSSSARRAGRRWADRLTGDPDTLVAREGRAAMSEPP